MGGTATGATGATSVPGVAVAGAASGWLPYWLSTAARSACSGRAPARRIRTRTDGSFSLARAGGGSIPSA